MTRPLYRHGDVFLQAIDAPGSRLHRQNHVTLAYGEVTGHTHRIADPLSAVLYSATPQPQNGREQFLQVTGRSATLVHEEHGPITLPAGWYRVWQQREYTPGSVRVVLD